MEFSSQFETAERVYGAGSSDVLFKGFPKTTAPWPRAGRLKKGSPYDQELLQRHLAGPPNIEEVDPRHLFATQPYILQEHVNYYMGDDYAKTGRTARDSHQNANQVPRVYVRPGSRMDILSGHHRGTAALLRGEQFRADVIREQ